MTSPDLFRLVFRYVNRGSTSVNGQISVREEGKLSSCTNCEWGLLTASFPTPYHPSHAGSGPGLYHLHPGALGVVRYMGEVQTRVVCGFSLIILPSPPTPGTEQSQPVAFPPSTEPAFVTVPQRGFGEPFVLNPGIWALLVEAEGVLLVRQGPWQGGVGSGPQSSCTHPAPLSGLRGPTAQHLL